MTNLRLRMLVALACVGATATSDNDDRWTAHADNDIVVAVSPSANDGLRGDSRFAMTCEAPAKLDAYVVFGDPARTVTQIIHGPDAGGDVIRLTLSDDQMSRIVGSILENPMLALRVSTRLYGVMRLSYGTGDTAAAAVELVMQECGRRIVGTAAGRTAIVRDPAIATVEKNDVVRG